MKMLGKIKFISLELAFLVGDNHFVSIDYGLQPKIMGFKATEASSRRPGFEAIDEEMVLVFNVKGYLHFFGVRIFDIGKIFFLCLSV
jgi:hypothetical protein